jgi:hypothetical protein
MKLLARHLWGMVQKYFGYTRFNLLYCLITELAFNLAKSVMKSAQDEALHISMVCNLHGWSEHIIPALT